MKNIQFVALLKERKDKEDLRNKESLDKIKEDCVKAVMDFDSRTSEILKLSKASINNSINSEYKHAQQSLIEAVRKLVKLDKDLKEFQRELSKGIFLSAKVADLQGLKIDSLEHLLHSASEECLEAQLVFDYFKSQKIKSPKLSVFSDLEIFVGALCDMCGELQRKARLEVIEDNLNAETNIRKYYEDTKDIYDSLSSFAFSNRSGLRSKIENLKGYIATIERILYDLKVR